MGNVDNIYVFKDTEELCRLNDTRNYDDSIREVFD